MGIGERIKAAREKTGMTQVELGKKVGVSGVAIMRYEKGQRQPRLEQLRRIAAALEVTVASLLPDYVSHLFTDALWSGYEASQFEYELDEKYLQSLGYSFSKKERSMIAVFSKMDDKGQDRIIDYAEDILPRYRATDALQSAQLPQEGTDTTPSEKPSQRLQEGEE